MGARGSPTVASQVTPTQALEMLEYKVETIPDTKMPVSDLSEVSATQTNDRHRKSGATTQPPNPTEVAIPDFTMA